jgi:NADH-quinone oxidoreductase subunit A
VGQYLPVVTMLVLALLFAGLSIVASRLLAPSRSTIAKRAPYECGIVPGREPPERFPVRFYLVAMIFIVFDIEIIFLYPWAVIYRPMMSSQRTTATTVRRVGLDGRGEPASDEAA